MNEGTANEAPKPNCVPCPLALLGLLVVAVLGFGWISLVIQKVISGAGLEHCCAIEGVRFNYIAAFVLICGTSIGFVIVAVLNVRDWLVRRDFERKYGVKVPTSTDHRLDGDEGNRRSAFHGADSGDGD